MGPDPVVSHSTEGAIAMLKKTTLMFGTVVFLTLFALPLAAQNASLVGTVKDQTGGAIPNVKVTLTNTATGVSRTTNADATGS